jgi:hypothetical protein
MFALALRAKREYLSYLFVERNPIQLSCAGHNISFQPSGKTLPMQR